MTCNTYTEFTVIEVFETVSALRLSSFTEIFKERTKLFRVLQIVRCTACGSNKFAKWYFIGKDTQKAYTSRRTFEISAKRKGRSMNSRCVISRVKRSCRCSACESIAKP